MLTAFGPGGSDTLTRTSYIFVTNPPPPVIADFTAQPTSGAVPLTVYFTNLSSGAGSYSWDFGDGNSSSIPSPVHTYTNAGGYSVSLTAVGPGGYQHALSAQLYCRDQSAAASRRRFCRRTDQWRRAVDGVVYEPEHRVRLLTVGTSAMDRSAPTKIRRMCLPMQVTTRSA